MPEPLKVRFAGHAAERPPEIQADTPALLRRVALFADLEIPDLDGLGRRFTEVTLPALSRIYSHGERAEHFFVIKRGEVSIFRSEVGKPVTLQARLGIGDFFGETGLFGGGTRSSSARTSVETELLRIDKEALLGFLEEHPATAVKIQIAAARRHSENVSAALDLGLRKEVRIRLDKPVVVETPFHRQPAVLENLSQGGLCLRSAPAAWMVGGGVRFTLAYKEERLAVIARISWREQESVGLAFTEPDGAHEERIQRFLRILLLSP